MKKPAIWRVFCWVDFLTFKRPLHNCSERSKFGSRSAPGRLYSEHGIRSHRTKIRPRSKLCRGLFNVAKSPAPTASSLARLTSIYAVTSSSISLRRFTKLLGSAKAPPSANIAWSNNMCDQSANFASAYFSFCTKG
jgi:hypothetical protein